MSIAIRVRCITWRPCLSAYTPTSHCTYRTLARVKTHPGFRSAGGSHNSFQFPHLAAAVFPNGALNRHALVYSTDSMGQTTAGKFELVYRAPLKGAVRAIKVFSLCTAAAAMMGGPVLVWMGNPSVPLVGRVALSTLVMLVGISTTAILHWLLKGYVIKMEYNKETEKAIAHVISLTARVQKLEFAMKDVQPAPQGSAFSTFQVYGKQYFVHTEVMKDKQLVSRLHGSNSL